MTTGADARETERARTLLIEMLASIRHSRATPLYFGIDAPRIVAAALRKVDAGGAHPARPCAASDAAQLCAAMDRLARDALGCLAAADEGSDDGSAPLEALRVPATWLEDRQHLLGSVHPLAMDVLGLLVEGESKRDVAERLDLGLRLTRRIARDARVAWMERWASCSSR